MSSYGQGHSLAKHDLQPKLKVYAAGVAIKDELFEDSLTV